MAKPTSATEGANKLETSDTATDVVSRWLTEIRLAEQRSKRWREECKKIVERYRNELREANEGLYAEGHGDRFNIFWSNVQTLQPALYARKPVPQVTRRFHKKDPVGRLAAMTLEDCLQEAADDYEFHSTIRACVLDYLLVGRGVLWIRYVPTYGDELEETDGNPVVDENGQPVKEVAYESVVADYVDYRDFIHGPGRRWSEVPWIGKRVFMSREELAERFGKDIGNRIALDYQPDDLGSEDSTENKEQFKKAQIFEIWDKKDRKVRWFSKGYNKAPLDEQDDPLALEGFFPVPCPLFATMTNDKLTPVPDYVEYRSQAAELDRITGRLQRIIDAFRVCGAYDAECSELAFILQRGAENQLIPVKNWMKLQGQGGLSGAIDFLPIEQLAVVIQALYEAREQTKNLIYETTGMSDIIRGNSDPRETATAQQIKGQFAVLRLTDRQNEVQRFVRDALCIMGEIVSKHFSPQTMAMIAGVENWQPEEQQAFPQVVELLQSDMQRTFRVDIETDSTLAVDDQRDKQERAEFIQAISQFLQTAIPIAAQVPVLVPMLKESMLYLVRGLKAGIELEEVIEQGMEQLEQYAQIKLQQSQSQPNPQQQQAQLEAQKAQTQIQAQQAKIQLDSQKQQNDLAITQAKAQADIEIAQAKAQADMEIARQQALRDMIIKQEAAAQQQRLALQKNAAMIPTF